MQPAHIVLITGINGFIGRALCRRLVADGLRVKGITRTAAAHAGLTAEAALHAGGPLETLAVPPEFMDRVDRVVHLAARVHVRTTGSTGQLAAFRATNVEGTRRIARAAAEAGVPRFLYVSSVKAIGEGGPKPYDEATAEHPEDPYGISKLEAERVVTAIGAETGMETVILRSPLVYGPGVQANFLRLMRLVDRGVPLPLASVVNRRSLIYLENVVDALAVCLNHERAAGQTFVISDGADLTTPGLIREIAGAIGKKPRLLPFPTMILKLAGTLAGKGPEFDRLLGSLSVDIGKIRSRLAWEPPFTAVEGIAKTVAWYLGTVPGRDAPTSGR